MKSWSEKGDDVHKAVVDIQLSALSFYFFREPKEQPEIPSIVLTVLELMQRKKQEKIRVYLSVARGQIVVYGWQWVDVDFWGIHVM